MDLLMISPNNLPNAANAIFEESSFFKRFDARLPSPADVRLQAARRKGSPRTPSSRPWPVQYLYLNLLVKYGSEITIAEGQCLWFLYHYLGRDVPVPELYGWRQDGGETFLFMELIHGDTLEQRWDSLTGNERTSVCNQLRHMTASWRRLRQHSSPQFVGQIGGQALRDMMFYQAFVYPAGPFPDIHTFHDWFARLSCRVRPELFSRDEWELSGLSDDQPIIFTHGDLHRSNILISPREDGAARVIAIIDWHQSGWYPRDWEFLKARWTADIYGKWATQYIPQFLTPPCLDYWRAWEWISLSIA